jgi:hypothetical protein
LTVQRQAENPTVAGIRPWYREPWPWVLIAIPLLTVIASAITFWLAVSHPDYIVLDESEYQDVKSELRAQSSPESRQATYQSDGDR